MEWTLQELSQKLHCEYVGQKDLTLTHVCGLDSLTKGGLAYLSNPKEMASLPTPTGVFDSKKKSLDQGGITSECAFVAPLSMAGTKANLILSQDPLKTHVAATRLIHSKKKTNAFVHPSASIAPGVKLGKNVTIHANASLYEGVEIGEGTVIHAGAVLMDGVKLGKDCLLYPNVTITEGCMIGDRVILHAGSVIGADGFGFYQRDGINHKIPQVGIVVLGDDVEIGACTAIDRARFTKTVIEDGSKLDNLIHIAHNVEIGEQSLIAAQSGVAGSTKIGRRLMMGGQAGVRDNLVVGDQVTLLARTLITSRTRDKEVVAGMPSRPLEEWRDIQAKINNLKSLYERVKELEKIIQKQKDAE